MRPGSNLETNEQIAATSSNSSSSLFISTHINIHPLQKTIKSEKDLTYRFIKALRKVAMEPCPPSSQAAT